MKQGFLIKINRGERDARDIFNIIASYSLFILFIPVNNNLLSFTGKHVLMT